MVSLFLKFVLFTLLCTAGSFLSCQSQSNDQANKQMKPARKDLSGMAAAANKFLMSLSQNQKNKIQFSFDDSERYNWHYIPKSRKGLPLKELETSQYSAAMELLHTVFSDTGFQKTTAIFQLEGILKVVEGRPENDDHRDPGKYYFSMFGNPATDSVCDNMEGHHVSFNFSAVNNTIVSATPGFYGHQPCYRIIRT